MRKHLVTCLLVLAAFSLIVTACGTPATPTPLPKPTLPPTPVPPPTVVLPPTPVPTTAPTAAPIVVPTLVPTVPPVPTTPPTPVPPTQAPTRVVPRVTATPTALKLPAPRGSIAYHKEDGGIDRIFVLNLDKNLTTPLVDVGPVMDISLSTNAHVGDFSPDNSKFAYVQVTGAGGANILRVLDFASNQTSSPYSDAGISSPSWSADGSKIAFIRMFNNQALWGVDIINADGSGRTEIRTNTGGEQYRGGLSWSKSGLLAFAQNTTGPNGVYTLFSDGGGLTFVSKSPKSDDSNPAFSPDGKQIAFTSTRDGRQQIYVVNADGTALRRVSQSTVNDWSPTWSQDGNWIAFTSTRQGSTDIYIMDTHGGNVKRMTTTGGDRPVWSK
jgi:Tol biopolymer transport system component